MSIKLSQSEQNGGIIVPFSLHHTFYHTWQTKNLFHQKCQKSKNESIIIITIMSVGCERSYLYHFISIFIILFCFAIMHFFLKLRAKYGLRIPEAERTAVTSQAVLVQAALDPRAACTRTAWLVDLPFLHQFWNFFSEMESGNIRLPLIACQERKSKIF